MDNATSSFYKSQSGEYDSQFAFHKGELAAKISSNARSVFEDEVAEVILDYRIEKHRNAGVNSNSGLRLKKLALEYLFRLSALPVSKGSSELAQFFSVPVGGVSVADSGKRQD